LKVESSAVKFVVFGDEKKIPLIPKESSQFLSSPFATKLEISTKNIAGLEI